MTTIDGVARHNGVRNRTAMTAFVFGLLAVAGGATFFLGKALPDSLMLAVIQALLIAVPAIWLIVVVLAIVLGHLGFARARALDGSGRGLSLIAFVLGYLALIPAALMVWLTLSGLALWGPWFGLLR